MVHDQRPVGRKVAKARASRASGRVVRIDLGDGRCGYGRQLSGVIVEFYDRVGVEGEVTDLLELVAEPVAFRIWVMSSAFRRDGWDLLDVVTLDEDETTRIHRFAKQDPITGRISIYWSDPVSGAFGERAATFPECRDLETAAVWSGEHVEDRLRDHFDGRPNKWVDSLRLKP